MAAEGCGVALVARLSCGLYAGPHRAAIGVAFDSALAEVLAEPVGLRFATDAQSGSGGKHADTDAHVTRGHLFDRVIVPMLA